MNREFLNEAINLFDTPEKWNYFLELYSKKDQIKDLYFIKVQTDLNKIFRQIDVVENWDFSIKNNQYKWFLKEFGEKSLCIYFNTHNGIFHFLGDADNFDLDKVKAALKTEYFAKILNFIERIDEINDGWHLVIEKGNFNFSSAYDGNFDGDKLAWYAGNRTEEFVNQIVEKVNRIRKSPELTQLLRELSEQCKR